MGIAEAVKDMVVRIIHGFTEWDRWIHIVFLFLAGFVSLHFNDPRYFIAGCGGALAYSIAWFKVATSRL
jgi:hypothetical protein